MNTPKLSPKQFLALPLLAAGKSGVETAKTLGIHNTTVSEWLNHDMYFIAELKRLRDIAAEDAMNQLKATLNVAVSVIGRLLTEAQSESVRLRAAEFIVTQVGFSGPYYLESNSINDMPSGLIDMNLILKGFGIGSD